MEIKKLKSKDFKQIYEKVVEKAYDRVENMNESESEKYLYEYVPALMHKYITKALKYRYPEVFNLTREKRFAHINYNIEKLQKYAKDTKNVAEQ